MRILLLGRTGQLGWELQRTLATLGEVIALDFPQIDLTRQDGIHLAVKDIQPEIIINATAYTAVDQAESEPDIAMSINGRAPGWLAEMAAAHQAAFIHYSTDYVFDGTKGSPYIETDPPNPLNVYGHSKLAGEQAISQVGGAYLILRTSWVYSLRRDSFVTKVLSWARANTKLRLVTDQIGNPTWARMLAEATAQLLFLGGKDFVSWLNERKGIYHLAGDGIASRMDWAQAILRHDPHKEEQNVQELLPALTAEFPTPAQRPLYSALDCHRSAAILGLKLPPWEYALQLAMDIA